MKEDFFSSVAFSLNKWRGISIYTDHGVFNAINSNTPVSIDNVIGIITNTVWNEKDQGIDFFGEIVDEDIAMKIFHGLIKFISVGFARTPGDGDDVVVLKDIIPKESSLVFNPRDKKAAFKPMV